MHDLIYHHVYADPPAKRGHQAVIATNTEIRELTCERPSTVDLTLFAHTSLLLVPAYPNRIMADLIRAEFPLLAAHHDALTTHLFPSGWSSITVAPSSAHTSGASSSASTWGETIRSYLPTSFGGAPATAEEAANAKPKPKKSEAERKFARGRWAFWIGAGAAMVGYLLAAGIVRIELGGEDDEEWDEDDDEEGDDGGVAGIASELIDDDDEDDEEE